MSNQKKGFRVETAESTERRGSERTAQPPALMRRSSVLIRVYYVNHRWKSLVSKALVSVYMAVIWWLIFRDCNPWYEFFFYLTLQGWTIELIYFGFSFYLDALARWRGGAEHVSTVAKAAAQALSEVVFASQVVIVVFFWAVVYPQETWRDVWWELNCHGLGLLLILVDYLYRFTGFSLRNHRYVLAFAATYSALHVTVVRLQNKPIYPGIDFQSVNSLVIYLLGLSTLVLTHKVIYLISNWRWIKEDLKTVLGVSYIILLRQNSFDVFVAKASELGSELLSLSPRRGEFSPPPRGRAYRSYTLPRSLSFQLDSMTMDAQKSLHEACEGHWIRGGHLDGNTA